MRSPLGDMQVDDKFVKEVFLERLPADVQTILASGSQDLTVSQLAEMADRMIEVQRLQSPSVAQISTSSPTRFIDHVLRGLPFVCAYIDDLLVASRNEEEHKEHLALMFDRLDKFGVVINPSECVLGVPSLVSLSHHVDSEVLRPLSSKVEAARNFPPPTSKRQL
ncbi:hypothetical protein SprV_0200860300 [Sparganum proliferum]